MTDVIERLRDLSPGYGNVIADAVHEIERLREKVSYLEECIRAQDRLHGQPDASGSYNGTGSAY